MEKRALLNRIRSLYNIDGYRLPELTSAQQSSFVRDPVGYFLRANEAQSDAIMREVEGRQLRRASTAKAQKLRKGRRGSLSSAKCYYRSRAGKSRLQSSSPFDVRRGN